LNVAVGQLSDPYNQGEQDDDVEITLSGLPSDDEPFGAPEIDELDDEMADLIADDDGKLDDAVNASGDEAESEIEASLHVEDEDGATVDAASDDDDFVDEEADADDGGDEEADDEDEDEDGEDEIAYDLAEWEDDRLDLLFDRLEAEGIGYLWDGEELFVRETDEEDADRVLEEVSNPEALLATEDGDGGGALLGELFVVADILRHDPDDPDASVRLLELDRTAEGAEPPYGLAEPEWETLREKVKAAADLLLVEGSIDGDAVVDAANELRTAIRPYV
jgi:hypothetical protein